MMNASWLKYVLISVLTLSVVLFNCCIREPKVHVSKVNESVLDESLFVVNEKARFNLIPQANHFFCIISDTVIAKIDYEGNILTTTNLKEDFGKLDSIAFEHSGQREKGNLRVTEVPIIDRMLYHSDKFCRLQMENDTLKAIFEVGIAYRFPDDNLILQNELVAVSGFDSDLTPTEPEFYPTFQKIQGYGEFTVKQHKTSLIEGVPFYTIRTSQEFAISTPEPVLVASTIDSGQTAELFTNIDKHNYILNGFFKNIFEGYVFVNQSASGMYYVTDGHNLFILQEDNTFQRVMKLAYKDDFKDKAEEFTRGFSVIADSLVAYHYEYTVKNEDDKKDILSKLLIKEINNGNLAFEMDLGKHYSLLGFHNYHVVGLRKDSLENIIVDSYEISINH